MNVFAFAAGRQHIVRRTLIHIVNADRAVFELDIKLPEPNWNSPKTTYCIPPASEKDSCRRKLGQSLRS